MARENQKSRIPIDEARIRPVIDFGTSLRSAHSTFFDHEAYYRWHGRSMITRVFDDRRAVAIHANSASTRLAWRVMLVSRCWRP